MSEPNDMAEPSGASGGSLAWIPVTERLRQWGRLTDAEREALEWCLEMAMAWGTDCDDEIATLRGLLERLQ